MKKITQLNPEYFRNFVFGAEDSLVSTVGVLFGITTAHYDQRTIIVTGLVVVSVEALSMGAGAFLSESSTHELDSAKDHTDNPAISGMIMFFSYFIAGFIPLLPYFLVQNESAKYASLAFSLAALFILGYFPRKSIRSALRMAVVAGFAVLVGFAIGFIAHY